MEVRRFILTLLVIHSCLANENISETAAENLHAWKETIPQSNDISDKKNIPGLIMLQYILPVCFPIIFMLMMVMLLCCYMYKTQHRCANPDQKELDEVVVESPAIEETVIQIKNKPEVRYVESTEEVEEINEETPTINEEKASIQEVMEINEETPAINEEAAIIQEVMEIREETPAINEEKASIQEVMEINEETPAINEEAAIIQEVMEIREETPAINEVSTSILVMVEIHEETPKINEEKALETTNTEEKIIRKEKMIQKWLKKKTNRKQETKNKGNI
ncbi:uncharacterized protein LOC143769251 [Ranitomeya variabilis]|uniref:uncharacterized protein LOC143769251 n=1 Tax=Ranitomeya variabilis TaxID=490064 RepID=UPI00405792DE